MDKDKGIVDTTWNIRVRLQRHTWWIHPMDLSFVFHFSWGSLLSILLKHFMLEHFEQSTHPSIDFPPWCTMTARPPTSPRSLPCSSPLKCVHESEAQGTVLRASHPSPLSPTGKRQNFPLKICRIGMCHWKLLCFWVPFFKLTERYVVWTRMLTSSKKKNEVPPCLQWFKVDKTYKSLLYTVFLCPLFSLVAFLVHIAVFCRDGGGQKL